MNFLLVTKNTDTGSDSNGFNVPNNLEIHVHSLAPYDIDRNAKT